MGRLTKAKIDQIVKMRKEGYTQQETAQKIGVHIRTVRKYDTTRTQHGLDPKTLLRNIQQDLLIHNEWIEVLANHLLRNEENLSCPCCLADAVNYDEDVNAIVCERCNHRLVWPVQFCENCLAHNSIDFDRGTHKHVCRQCGARQLP